MKCRATDVDQDVMANSDKSAIMAFVNARFVRRSQR
jgi:hypothetical protein